MPDYWITITEADWGTLTETPGWATFEEFNQVDVEVVSTRLTLVGQASVRVSLVGKSTARVSLAGT